MAFHWPQTEILVNGPGTAPRLARFLRALGYIILGVALAGLGLYLAWILPGQPSSALAWVESLFSPLKLLNLLFWDNTTTAPQEKLTAANIINSLASLPGARDFWAVLAQAPAVSIGRMDVGGSGALTQRPVTVASFSELGAIVTAGLEAGEKVVTLGVQTLVEGLKVRAIEIN